MAAMDDALDRSILASDPEVDQREYLGRRVRQAWITWAEEQPDPKPSWLLPWEDLDDGQREVDMRIGEAIAEEVRELIAHHVELFVTNYPADVFPSDSTSRDAIGGTAMRHAYFNAARSIRDDWGAGLSDA